MLDDILKTADLYAQGVQHVEARRDQWLQKHTALRDHLKEIAQYLNDHAGYKQGFFVDTLHAFNEEIHGVCAEMPSVSFRSGDMPMRVSFRNAAGEKKEYIEEGFRVSFNPTITGELVVLLYPHRSELDQEQEQGKFASLAVIKEPSMLTMETVDQLINKGIEIAYYSSYTGMAELQQQQEAAAPLNIPKHNTIGFKRYETTEKVQ